MDLFQQEWRDKRQNDDVQERLSNQHLQDLRESGLNDQTIRQAGLVTVSPEAAEEYLGFWPGSECLVFEYAGANSYFRLKPLRPLSGSDGETRKYLAAEGGGNHLYLPPGLIEPEAIEDTDADLVITEGEKKALKAVQEGFMALGIPGVWSWRTTADETGETEPVEELDDFDWHQRDVYLAFDSDAATNPHVQEAEDALAEELHGRGAEVRIVRLPDLGEGKTGLDDFLLARGADAFRELQRRATPPVAIYFSGRRFVALRLAEELLHRDRYLYGADPESGGGRLYVYRKGVYRPAGDVLVKAHRLLGDETKTARIEAGVEALEREVFSPIGRLNANSDRLINLKNGLLDPFTGHLSEHDPDCYSTIQLPVRWDPEARSPRLDTFLETVCGEWADTVCELTGYLLLPINLIKRLFILHGPTDTGKTTLLNLICALVGRRNYSSISPQQFSERFMLSQLEGKLVNIFDDSPAERIRNSSALKVLSGGAEYLQVERKHEQPYKARNTCRALFCANELPTCSDKSDAWYGRLCLLPFKNVIPDDERDPGLRRQFSEDRAIRRAMLVRAVEGLRRLKERGWSMEGSQKELDEYRAANDPVMAFVQERCTVDPEARVKRTELRAAYEAYCEERGLYRLATARKFYGRVRDDRRFSECTLNGYKHFRGLRLSGGVDR